MIQLYDQRIAVIARAETWTVSLVQFSVAGDIMSDVFIVTRCFDNDIVSQLYHFSSVARRMFLQTVTYFQRETGEQYSVDRVEL